MIVQTTLTNVTEILGSDVLTKAPVVSNEGIHAMVIVPFDSWTVDARKNYSLISAKLAAAVDVAVKAGLHARTFFGFYTGYDYIELSELPLAQMLPDNSQAKRKAICEMYAQGEVTKIDKASAPPMYVLKQIGMRFVPVDGTVGLYDGSVVLSLSNPVTP